MELPHFIIKTASVTTQAVFVLGLLIGLGFFFIAPNAVTFLLAIGTWLGFSLITAAFFCLVQTVEHLHAIRTLLEQQKASGLMPLPPMLPPIEQTVARAIAIAAER